MVPRPTTDFLVPTSSFFTGAGTVLNLAGNFFDYNESTSPEEADYIALLNDWSIAGQDLHDAMASEVVRKLLIQYSANHGKTDH